MAFPTGWAHRAALILDQTKIDADLTNWTLVFDQSFLSELTQVDGPLDADGLRPSLNGGGDIRFSSDAAGATRLACDIRTWVTNNTPASATCEVAVNITSVSSSVDTTIYMWWGKAAETQPAVSDTYGQYNAYDSSTVAVYPFTEASITFYNRKSNSYHLDGDLGTSASATAGIGTMIETDGSTDLAYSSNRITPLESASNATMEYLAKRENKDSNSTLCGTQGYESERLKFAMLWYSATDKVYTAIPNSAGVSLGVSDSAYDSSALTHMACRYDGTQGTATNRQKTYLNATEIAQTVSGQPYASTLNSEQRVIIGGDWVDAASDYRRWAGRHDELRFSNITRSVEWLKANYNNQCEVSGFLTAGTVVDVAFNIGKVNGVPWANIGKINGVSRAFIKKVNGVT
jgi:hypothetical protein